MSQSEQKVVQYLNEAHASEVALVNVLAAQIAMAPRGTYRSGLETHLRETRDHAQRVQRRLGELGQGDNPFQAVAGAAQAVAGQALALAKTPLDLIRGSGGEEKILKNAKDACATEALEIATYTALERLAQAVGDTATASLAASIRADEEKMLDRLMREIPKLTKAVVAAEIEGNPSYDVTETGAADAARAVGSEAGRTVRKGARQARRTARKTRDQTARTARQAANDTRRTARKAADDTRRTARKAGDETGRAARKAGNETGRTARKAADDTNRTARKAAADTNRAARKAGDDTNRTARKAGAQARRTARQTRRVPGAAQAEGQVKGAVASEEDLPIARYSALTAEDIVGKLPELSQIDLAKVDSYERKNDDRSTVLTRVEALRGDEPWPGYDEQTAAQIQTALAQADEARSKEVRSYERAHKNRAGVLGATEREATS